MIWSVLLEKSAEKDLKKVPPHILITFNIWRLQVIELGLSAVQGNATWHDRPKRGKLSHMRSASLNQKYRVIYRVKYQVKDNQVIVEGVSHDYEKIERGY
jgi:mRNA-degrading endonuclease RelE of RelBE toxin-antitoxin system